MNLLKQKLVYIDPYIVFGPQWVIKADIKGHMSNHMEPEQV